MVQAARRSVFVLDFVVANASNITSKACEDHVIPRFRSRLKSSLYRNKKKIRRHFEVASGRARRHKLSVLPSIATAHSVGPRPTHEPDHQALPVL